MRRIAGMKVELDRRVPPNVVYITDKRRVLGSSSEIDKPATAKLVAKLYQRIKELGG